MKASVAGLDDSVHLAHLVARSYRVPGGMMEDSDYES